MKPGLASTIGIFCEESTRWLCLCITLASLCPVKPTLLKLGLESVCDMGFRMVILKVDWNVVARVIDESRVDTEWNQWIIFNIQSIMRCNSVVSIKHTLCEENSSSEVYLTCVLFCPADSVGVLSFQELSKIMENQPNGNRLKETSRKLQERKSSRHKSSSLFPHSFLLRAIERCQRCLCLSTKRAN